MAADRTKACSFFPDLPAQKMQSHNVLYCRHRFFMLSKAHRPAGYDAFRIHEHIGGFGNLPGAVIGGLFLGLIETFGARYISSNFRDAYAFIVMIAVLVAWPRGLFGEKSSEKV